MILVWIRINCNADTPFIQRQYFSLKNSAKQQRSFHITAIWVGISVGFGGKIWLAAVNLSVGMCSLTIINFTSTLCYRKSELAINFIIKPDTVASHFAFPYTNWKRNIWFHARLSSKEKQCNT